VTNYLKKKKLSTFTQNTSYVGPTFNLVTTGASRYLSTPSVNLYSSPDGSFYFYNPEALGTSGFSDVSRTLGLSNLYKMKYVGESYFPAIPDAIFNNNTKGKATNIYRIAEKRTYYPTYNIFGLYISLSNDTLYSGTSCKYFIKLLEDGTPDDAFNQQAVFNFDPFSGTTTYHFNSLIHAIKIQSDSKILLGGSFTNYKATGNNRLIRLNIDGSLDTAFSTNANAALSSVTNIYDIEIQSDGKIIILCNESNFKLKRLNINGTEDTTYYTNSSAIGFNFTATSIVRIKLQFDGKLYIFGGSLNHFVYGSCYILRLNTNGTEDTTFTNTVTRPSGVNAFNGPIRSVLEYGNKLFFGGTFTQWTTSPANQGLSYLVAFNSDLTLASTFNDVAVRNGTTPLLSISNSSSFPFQLSPSFNGLLIVTGSFINYKNIKFLNNCIFISPHTGEVNMEFSKRVSYGTRSRKFHGAVTRIKYSSHDDSYVVGGGFLNYGELFYSSTDSLSSNTLSSYVVKLNSDGTSDNYFNTNCVYLGVSRFNASVSDVAVQNDGKVNLAGLFTNVSYSDIGPSNINNINYFLRLNSDGTPDQSFITNSSIRFSGGVYVSRFSAAVTRTVVLSSGKILISGGFTNYTGSAGGTTTGLNRFIRLNEDGTEDRAYNDVATRNGTAGKFNSTINAICELSSGQVLVGGAFTNYGANTGYSRLIILNSSGSIGASELSFINNAIVSGTTAKFPGSVTSIVEQPDGKILIGGTFVNYGGITGITRLIRLNSDGTLDTAFSDNLKVGTLPKLTLGQIDTIQVDSDGKILVGGTFDYASDGSSNSHYRFIKLNSDGTLDSSFMNNVRFSPTYTTTISSSLIRDGKYFLGGSFTNYYEGRLSNNYDKFDYFVLLNKNGNIK